MRVVRLLVVPRAVVHCAVVPRAVASRMPRAVVRPVRRPAAARPLSPLRVVLSAVAAPGPGEAVFSHLTTLLPCPVPVVSPSG
ncbi:hypothetical protein GCM10010428_36140 [Actinosynnema pretiosum subsp. pretiosum]